MHSQEGEGQEAAHHQQVGEAVLAMSDVVLEVLWERSQVRHAFTVHLGELAVDVRTIQVLEVLGCRIPATTARYPQVACPRSALPPARSACCLPRPPRATGAARREPPVARGRGHLPALREGPPGSPPGAASC